MERPAGAAGLTGLVRGLVGVSRLWLNQQAPGVALPHAASHSKHAMLCVNLLAGVTGGIGEVAQRSSLRAQVIAAVITEMQPALQSLHVYCMTGISVNTRQAGILPDTT